MSSNGSDRVESLRRLFADLTVDEKIEFFDKELRESGLTVIFGGSNRVSSEICVNIYNSKDLEVDQVLQAIGAYIKSRHGD